MVINLPVAAQVIVLAAIAALLGGVARYISGEKMKLPDWASFAVGLFVFALVILAAKIAG